MDDAAKEGNYEQLNGCQRIGVEQEKKNKKRNEKICSRKMRNVSGGGNYSEVNMTFVFDNRLPAV